MGQRTSEIQSHKKSLPLAKVTTRLSGKIKDNFFTDAIQREVPENELARKIFDIYYSIIEINPKLRGKEFSEIKKEIISKFAY